MRSGAEKPTDPPKTAGRRNRWRRLAGRVGILMAAAVILAVAGFLAADALFPVALPDPGDGFAVTVVAADGTPLRSFPDSAGVWRYPITSADVSPRYLDALIHYEDRFFRYHPGVNPGSLLRAAWQYLKTGTPQTGGSTLTMQVARIFHPHNRSIPGKLRQIFRAVQLEWHLTKDEILSLYLNYAPFGGPIEGVQAASYAYLGKPAAELSHAEAALLAVLPQAPTRLRPDRHPDRAARARNKVLDRMVKFGVWDRLTAADAKMEQVMPWFNRHPLTAPLLARRLKGEAEPGRPLRTTIEMDIQTIVAERVRRHVAATPAGTSAAALVVENRELSVRAYVGSADFLDNSRYGHVDMVRADRSPGSTLKPFLYAFALEEGLIHSESLLVDAPISFSGYRPGNFTRSFSGPVSAAEALMRSLNLPAVDLLDRLTPRFFDARLRQGGLHLRYPAHAGPNLSAILGGAGISLEDLVAAFTAFGRDGLAGTLRFTPNAPLRERRMMTPGAAWIIRRILASQPRPDGRRMPAGRVHLDRSRDVAWKTGTSYGFRDAWTVGVTDRYTVGVWVGRPDGTPSPGQYGRATAAPLLFALIDSLPRHHGPAPPIPETVNRTEICWPLGSQPNGPDDPHCHLKKTAWTLNGVVPPTLPDRTDRHWTPNPMTILVNPETGLRVEADCQVDDSDIREVARWPRTATPWLTPRQRRLSRIPGLDPLCGRPAPIRAETVRIMGIEPGTVLRPPGESTRPPSITLMAQGGQGRLFWLLDGALIAQTGVSEPRIYSFRRPGRYRLAVMDLSGNSDAVELTVLAGG